MQPRWRLTALSLSLAFSPASVAAQTHYVTGAPTVVSAGAFDPVNPHEIGYFDSVPVGGNSPGFAGSWSNYPFFESGVIVFTSMREGLFVVRRGRQPVL